MHNGQADHRTSPRVPAAHQDRGRNAGGIRVGAKEPELQREVKQAGGRWNPAARIWEMPSGRAVALGLKDQIENAKVSIRRNRSVSICINLKAYTYGNKCPHIDASFYA